MTIRRWAAFLLGFALLASIAGRAAAAPPASRAPLANRMGPSLSLMRVVSDAWETRDPSRAARFYAREPGRLFFDLAPLQYRGWDAYASGASKALEPMKSLKITLHPGAAVRVMGRSAWGAATMHYDIELRDGARISRDARWTVVWEKMGATWLIVHEHVSFPDSPP